MAQGPRPLAADTVDHGGQLGAVTAEHQLVVEILGSTHTALGGLLLRQDRQRGDQFQRTVTADDGTHEDSGVHRSHNGAAAVQGRKMIVDLVAAVIGQTGWPYGLHPADALAAVYHQITRCKHHTRSLSATYIHIYTQKGTWHTTMRSPFAHHYLTSV